MLKTGRHKARSRLSRPERDDVGGHRAAPRSRIAQVLALSFSSVVGVSCDSAPNPGTDETDLSLTYAGSASCVPCHRVEVEAWTGSHHDLAMQEATNETVLGDFSGATLTHFGVTSSFTRRNGQFVVRTEGPDGSLSDFEVAFAFGVDPLQQYLIETPGGRYQALSVAWDTRPGDQGGQRWFALYPAERIAAGDPLHWTAPTMTWNSMCAECHSTNVRKNYDRASKSYETTWSEIDVSCEACHGPASRHLELMDRRQESRVSRGSRLDGAASDAGLVAGLADPGGWVIEPGATIASRTMPLASNAQVETCAHCHSRRTTIEEGRVAGSALHDADVVSRLEPGLYYPDGQILDEVYVYGSFVQSGMYRAGVRCSDCHDPHSLTPRASGNGLCSGCHLPSAYDTPAHHHHEESSSGAQCVECHMPAKTYMVVDPRRDHSLRVPDPRLSEALGVPNACNGCHLEESAAWAAEAVERWYGADRGPHFAEALEAGRSGRPGAGDLIRDVASDPTQSGIVRATALGLAGPYLSERMFEVVEASLLDADPMVRLGALSALEAASPEARFQVAFRMLRDPTRAVRIEAARLLAPASRESLTDLERELLDQVTGEYVAAQMVSADRPSSHMNVANVYVGLGAVAAAERSYRDAIAVDSTFVPAYLNLADLYRATLRDRDGEEVLRAGLDQAPDNASLQHAMGLLRVRLGDRPEAIRWLARAVELAPDEGRFAYVLGVALNSEGDSGAAIDVLETALERRPYDRELLTLLTQLHRDRGEVAIAREYAERLLEVAPDDPSVRRLMSDLGPRE